MIGVEGQGYVWNDKWEDVGDDEDEDPRQKLARCIGFLVRDADILCPDDEDNADTISDVLDDDSEDDEGAYDSETDDELTKHYLEAEDTVHRGITENHTVDNVALELNALKMGMWRRRWVSTCGGVLKHTFTPTFLACNMTFHDLRASCIPALLQHIDLKSPDSFRKVLGKWSKLLARLVNTDEDQVDCLRISFVGRRGMVAVNRVCAADSLPTFSSYASPHPGHGNET